MSKKPKVGMWSGLTAVTAVLTAGAIVGTTVAFHYTTTVNNYLDADTYKIIRGDSDEDTEYFKSDFTSDEERESYEAELCAQVEAEGAALLKNDNNALPLASGAKVSLFGHGSVDLMYGGTGSGSVDTSKAPNFKQALEDQGIQVNSTLWDLYSSDDMMKNYSRITPAAISDTLEANTQYAVNEAPWSKLSSAESSFADYGDAAIVVFSRSGGEGADLPSGENGTNDSWIKGQEGDGNYLALSAEEKELLQNLKTLKDNGTFKKIIVLINSSNAIEMDFLNPEICGEQTGTRPSFPELIAAAQEASSFAGIVSTGDDRFLAPKSMIKEVKAACKDGGKPVPATTGEVMQTIYNSLSHDYQTAIQELQSLTGKEYTSINIVGGGSQDMYLNQMTANATQLPVFAGPTEGTALGNLMVQMIRAGEFKDLADARASIKKSFTILECNPQ